MKVGLMGHGKAGQAVARVIKETPGLELRWIAKRHCRAEDRSPWVDVDLFGTENTDMGDWLTQHPVDAVVDFSDSQGLWHYADALERHGCTLVSAISAYGEPELARLKQMGQKVRVLSSPNITLGINFLMLAAQLLRQIAPFADVAVVEQHFKTKPEISGTARKIAETLGLGAEEVNALRLGGIVGHHEVIFGFPHQTVRMSHDAIRREAFGTGAVYALQAVSECPVGYYTFDDLLLKKIRQTLLA